MSSLPPNPRFLLLLLALCALWLISCDDPDELAPDCDGAYCQQADAGPDDIGPGDTGSDLDTDTSVDSDTTPDSEDSGAASQRIEIPAVQTTKTLAARVAIDGQGTDHVGAIDVEDSTGSVVIGQESLDVLVYQKIPWEAFGRTLYQTIAVSAEVLYVMWFYCDGSDDLREIWLEGIDGYELTWEQGTGSCSGLDDTHSVEVEFPAVDWPIPETLDRFEVMGQDLEIGPDTENSVLLEGVDYQVMVFDEVDCTTECGGDGWYELHALLWDPAAIRVYFGIFYLYEDNPQIQLAWVIGLPDLDEPGPLYFEASWSRE